MYRLLTEQEKNILIENGCSADNWDNIHVTENFSANYIKKVEFSGNINLGAFDNVFAQAGGFTVHSGIYEARLHNVSVGDNCYIHSIHNYIVVLYILLIEVIYLLLNLLFPSQKD